LREFKRSCKGNSVVFCCDTDCSSKFMWHYTKLSKVDDIINKNVLLLSDGSNWEDIVDSGYFNTPTSKYVKYGLCLSCSEDENVAMWKSYAKTGVVLEFTVDLLVTICNNSKVVFTDDNGKEWEYTGSRSLYLLEVQYGQETETSDHLYCKLNQKTKKLSLNMTEELRDVIRSFVKSKAWDFEKEWRLVLCISKYSLSKWENYKTVKLVYENVDLGNGFDVRFSPFSKLQCTQYMGIKIARSSLYGDIRPSSRVLKEGKK